MTFFEKSHFILPLSEKQKESKLCCNLHTFVINDGFMRLADTKSKSRNNQVISNWTLSGCHNDLNCRLISSSNFEQLFSNDLFIVLRQFGELYNRTSNMNQGCYHLQYGKIK